MTRIKRDIIDNTTDDITMSDVLNSEIPQTEKLDISTGYFNVPGYTMLKDALNEAAQKDDFGMRLLLGSQALIPDVTFEERAQESGEDAVSLKSDLDDAELTLDAMSDTASLISLLTKRKRAGKAWQLKVQPLKVLYHGRFRVHRLQQLYGRRTHRKL